MIQNYTSVVIDSFVNNYWAFLVYFVCFVVKFAFDLALLHFVSFFFKPKPLPNPIHNLLFHRLNILLVTQ